MWRLNWIHPFADGNGRTSRILSYVVLSIRSGALPPGTPTIPDLIVENRQPYFAAIAPEPVAVGSGSRFILKVIASSDPDDANNVARPGIDHNPYAVSAPVTP